MSDDRGRPAADAIDQSTVDVIVPVYGAASALRRCLDSVVDRTSAAHRLLLVIDGPQPDDVEVTIADFVAHPRIEVLRSSSRRGFVASVSRGIAASRRDVVLLNSDTEVTSGWLGRMRQAAASRPRIATVTPFSNNATICSLPRFLVENDLPVGHDVESFGRVVEQSSTRLYPELPTGIGFCLYVRRAALDAAGAFDEKRFGLGYGEEVDFSMRASRLGFVHLLDDATFVYHQGQGSFGLERDRRVRAAHRIVRRAHPGYLPEIDRFIREDPLRPLRERVISRLSTRRSGATRRPARVLHVVHGFPPDCHGGTELYARWLARRQALDRSVAVFTRLARRDRREGEIVERLDGDIRVRAVVNNFTQRNPLSRNGLVSPKMDRALDRFLDEIDPQLVHVHHLAGHAVSLLRVLGRRRLPVVYQVQDWWAPCARANLFHREGFLCGGPAPVKCGHCLPMTGLPGATLWNPLLYLLRRKLFIRQLRVPKAFVMGSRSIAESYRDDGLLPSRAHLQVLPYGIDRPSVPSRTHRTGRPLRFGYLGAVLPHKGVEVAVEALARFGPEEAVLEVWGTATEDPGYAARLSEISPDNVRFHGPLPEGRKAAALADLDALIVPSLGLESFGLVAREALALGVPVLASRRGALVEIFDDGAPGWLFEPGDSEELAARIRRLLDDPGILEAWRSRPHPVKGIEEHAAEIDRVYAEVLGERGR